MVQNRSKKRKNMENIKEEGTNTVYRLNEYLKSLEYSKYENAEK